MRLLCGALLIFCFFLTVAKDLSHALCSFSVMLVTGFLHDQVNGVFVIFYVYVFAAVDAFSVNSPVKIFVGLDIDLACMEEGDVSVGVILPQHRYNDVEHFDLFLGSFYEQNFVFAVVEIDHIVPEAENAAHGFGISYSAEDVISLNVFGI